MLWGIRKGIKGHNFIDLEKINIRDGTGLVLIGFQGLIVWGFWVLVLGLGRCGMEFVWEVGCPGGVMREVLDLLCLFLLKWSSCDDVSVGNLLGFCRFDVFSVG